MLNEGMNLNRAQAVIRINSIQFRKHLQKFYYLSRAVMGTEETKIDKIQSPHLNNLQT